MATLPQSFVHLLAAWNEQDLQQTRSHLNKALAPNILFADPNFLIQGIDAFENMIKEFRQNAPKATCIHSSGYDAHHSRYRYQWTVNLDKNTQVIGYDVTTLNSDGLVERIDGFFGELPE